MTPRSGNMPVLPGTYLQSPAFLWKVYHAPKGAVALTGLNEYDINVSVFFAEHVHSSHLVGVFGIESQSLPSFHRTFF